MPSNLDLVRSICAAWERGDFSSAEWADPQIEFVHAGGPAPGSWSGLAGMSAAEREFLNAWQDYRLVVEEYRELDDERVLALVHSGGRGKISGVELTDLSQGRGAALFHLRQGKVVRFVQYWERTRAFADLGVAPEA
jgi:ketosteroid isomerase-like protein